jgi:primase-polymerase (primpol)-like protein
VIVRASLPADARNREGPFEVYDHGRYFVMTGRHVDGTPTTIEYRQAEVDQILAYYLPARPSASARPAPQPVDLLDEDLLRQAFAAKNGASLKALYRGDTSAYKGDHSAADLALCRHLAFWTGRDPARIDQLFRSSGLYREKWERADYRERTIETATAATTDVYQPLTRNVGPTSKPSNPSYLKERGVPSDIPGKCDLRGVLNAFGELLVLPDPGPVEIALAAVVANYASGDPVWPLLVGPPGCGKSEIVSALRDAPGLWPSRR